jgi:uncharacterized membrane protein YfcA
VRRRPAARVNRVRRRALELLGKYQRPVAWVAFFVGIGIFVGTAVGVLFKDDAVSALFGSVLIVQGAWQSVIEVENEIDSEGAAEA